jgi:hypothetical protein
VSLCLIVELQALLQQISCKAYISHFTAAQYIKNLVCVKPFLCHIFVSYEANLATNRRTQNRKYPGMKSLAGSETGRKACVGAFAGHVRRLVCQIDVAEMHYYNATPAP